MSEIINDIDFECNCKELTNNLLREEERETAEAQKNEWTERHTNES